MTNVIVVHPNPEEIDSFLSCLEDDGAQPHVFTTHKEALARAHALGRGQVEALVIEPLKIKRWEDIPRPDVVRAFCRYGVRRVVFFKEGSRPRIESSTITAPWHSIRPSVNPYLLARLTLGGRFTDGDVVLDAATRDVLHHDRRAHLTLTEANMLSYVMRRQEEIISYEEMTLSCFGFADSGAPLLLRAHMSNLRGKLELAGVPRDAIRTIRGQGYIWQGCPQ